MDIQAFWKDVLAQREAELWKYFDQHAVVRWHNTNEQFTVGEFIRANCDYPGNWDGKIERIERLGNLLITATHVCSADRSLSFHVVSFIQLQDGKILSVDEYWGDDGAPPQWRLEKQIGTPISPTMGD